MTQPALNDVEPGIPEEPALNDVEPGIPEEPTPGGLARVWQGGRAVLETVLLGLLFYFLISQFVLQPFQVQQTSMEPTVEPGEYVLVDKLVAGFMGYHRGDIVVLRAPVGTPTEQGAPLIKRVVGLPGDRLQIEDGAVLINGVKLDEPYLPTGTVTEAADAGIDIVIPDDAVWVMGDHRSASTDSRVFGPVKINSIVGHALLRYWPLDRLSPLGSDPATETIAP